jgi:hypothetical protein
VRPGEFAVLRVDREAAYRAYREAVSLGMGLLIGPAFADQQSVSWGTPAGDQMDEIDRIIDEAR